MALFISLTQCATGDRCHINTAHKRDRTFCVKHKYWSVSFSLTTTKRGRRLLQKISEVSVTMKCLEASSVQLHLWHALVFMSPDSFMCVFAMSVLLMCIDSLEPYLGTLSRPLRYLHRVKVCLQCSNPM